MAGIKNYICQLLARSNYPKPIKTKDGRTFNGKLMVNPNYFSVEVKGRFQRMDWNSLPPSQIADILDYFADMRLKVSGAAGTTKETREKEAAQDYLRIAILYDWYGDYEKAVEYSKKSISVYADAEKSVKKIIMK